MARVIPLTRGKFAIVDAARCRGKHLGRYANEEDAAKAYDNFAVEEYGDFANLNFKP